MSVPFRTTSLRLGSELPKKWHEDRITRHRPLRMELLAGWESVISGETTTTLESVA